MSARPTDQAVSRLLDAAAQGDDHAGAQLLPLLYGELRRLAEDRMRKLPPGNTLQATALVHEAFLRLVGQSDPGWSGRGHFFGAAATAMRDILVEQARRKATAKRGGAARRVDADDVELPIAPPAEDIAALDLALRRLEAVDPEKAKIVMLRYFAGLSGAETAAALGVSTATIERQWRYARAWLRREIGARAGDG